MQGRDGAHGDAFPDQRLAHLIGGMAGQAELSADPGPLRQTLDPPPSNADAATLAAGARLFGRYGVACQGSGAISGGAVPDLRASPFLGDPVWFDSVPSDQDAAAIREYVMRRANDDKAAVR